METIKKLLQALQDNSGDVDAAMRDSGMDRNSVEAVMKSPAFQFRMHRIRDLP